jgi:carboxypeptidase Q
MRPILPILFVPCLLAQSFTVSPETRDAVRQLIGDTILNSQAYAYDQHLADSIGPRLTGSANYTRAADWAVQKFKALGLSNVHTEDWTIPATWEPEVPAVGRILKPVEHQLHIYSLGWSPSTPREGVEGQVVHVASLAPADLDAQKSRLTGAIAFLDQSSFGEKPTFYKTMAGVDRLLSFAPLALFYPGGANGTENLSTLTFGTLAAVPEAQIGREDVSLLRRLLQTGPVTARFSFTNGIRVNVQVPNVIAEIPGRELPNEVVIVAAHLDSWQPGTGAQDDGTGVAGVLEVARAIRNLNRAPRRTIRFILFGGEEQGLLGSAAYARQHAPDLPSVDAILVTDGGSQPANGWFVMGHEDEKTSLAALKPLLAGLGGDQASLDTAFLLSSDHAPFNVLGVPTLVLSTEREKYFALHHKASDTFDSVVQKDLTQGAAVIAVTAYAIADSQDPFAKHLSPAEVQSLLEKTGSIEQYNFLKKSGVMP